MIWEFQSNSIEHMNLYVVLGVLYLGIVSTAGAFFLWNKGLELMDASIGSLFFFFQPIVGSLLGWLLLNETLNSNFLLVVFLLYVAFSLLLLKRMKNRQRLNISAFLLHSLRTPMRWTGQHFRQFRMLIPFRRINLNLRQKNTICKISPANICISQICSDEICPA